MVINNIEVLLRKKEKKISDMVANNIKFSQKMKNKSQLSIEKNI